MPYTAPRLLLARYPQVSERQKPQIMAGDSFTVVYEARQMDATPSMNPQGLPSNVVSAYARVRASNSATLLEIGGPGITTATAQVLIGDEKRGDIVSYTLPGSFTTQQGSYVMYVTGVFEDDHVVTEARTFYVNGIG